MFSNYDILLPLLLLLPIFTGCIIAILKKPKLSLRISGISIILVSVLGLFISYKALSTGPIHAIANWFYIDSLSAYNLIILLTIYSLSSLFSIGYFDHEITKDHFPRNKLDTFLCLWNCALSSMILVLISNNIAVVWVGIESTTLLTAFLISLQSTKNSLEAMWKYILICSVGVAIAFMGTLLIAAAAGKAPGFTVHKILLWSELIAIPFLDPMLTKIGFIFIVVGYGTKAGLAPMHSWLPDAHSQAPAPVSALFSGFMLNTSLYCIMRYIPIVQKGSSYAWAGEILQFLGLLSIIIAAAFIIFQKDLKRLLAYCSVEHIGIITFGLGIGGLGTAAALFHTLNHSLCKSLSFFAAGKFSQILDSTSLEKTTGTWRISKLWSLALFFSLLALIGLAPFSIFISELQLFKSLIDTGSYVQLVIFALGLATIFIAMISFAISIFFGNPNTVVNQYKTRILDIIVVCIPLIAILTLGLWIPASLKEIIHQTTYILTNQKIIEF